MKLFSLTVLAFVASTALAAKWEDKFNEMDTDKDGRVSSTEHDTAMTTKFTAADANKDGSLTKGELTGWMMDEKGKSAGKAGKKADKKITQGDTNGDGMLTQQEMTDYSKSHFAKIDTNTDGALTKEEMETGFKKAHDSK